MSNIGKKRGDESSANDLRRTFETAVAQLGRRREPAKAPVAHCHQALSPDDLADEKRALNSAARALAQLWKISPSLVR